MLASGGGGGGSAVDVDLAALASSAAPLDSAAEGLESLSGSVPTGVDAGPMTAFITQAIATLTQNAGTLSSALSASADAVRSSRDYYQRTDADVGASLSEIQQVMEP